MDAAGIDDPVIRNAASLAAGILGGGIVGGAAKMKGIKQAEKLAELGKEAVGSKSAEAAKLSKKGVKGKKELSKGVKKKKFRTKEGDNRTSYAFDISKSPVEVTFDEVKLGISKRKLNDLVKEHPGIEPKVTGVAFTVGDDFDVSDAIPAREKGIAALKIKKIFDSHIASLPEGRIVACEAWAGDAYGAVRVKAFQAMGFSQPQGDLMVGIVKNGKLTPFVAPKGFNLAQYMGL